MNHHTANEFGPLKDDWSQSCPQAHFDSVDSVMLSRC